MEMRKNVVRMRFSLLAEPLERVSTVVSARRKSETRDDYDVREKQRAIVVEWILGTEHITDNITDDITDHIAALVSSLMTSLMLPHRCFQTTDDSQHQQQNIHVKLKDITANR